MLIRLSAFWEPENFFFGRLGVGYDDLKDAITVLQSLGSVE